MFTGTRSELEAQVTTMRDDGWKFQDVGVTGQHEVHRYHVINPGGRIVGVFMGASWRGAFMECIEAGLHLPCRTS